MDETQNLIVTEALNALRLSRRYKGKLSQDEFEYAPRSPSFSKKDCRK
jgi:hypothetical protein